MASVARVDFHSPDETGDSSDRKSIAESVLLATDPYDGHAWTRPNRGM